MPFIERPGNVKIYYEVHGVGQPLLLSHGYSSNSGMWQDQVAPFSKKHQLIIWDMRGHGKSDYPDDQAQYSEDRTIGDMLALLDKICSSKPAIVGGLSLGGYMSLAFYRRYPERVSTLLIIDTGPGFKSDKAREGWNETAYKTAKSFEENGLKVLQSLSPERSQVTHRNAKGLALAARGMLAQRNNAVMLSLPKISVPSLIIVGADDTPFLAAADYMKLKIPGAEKVVIPNAGHASNIDQPEVFNSAVLSFLAKTEGKGARL